MTVVAAISHAGRIVMAADTATNYSGTYVDGAIKIRNLQVGDQPALIAASGNGAILSIVERHLKLDHAPDPVDTGDVQKWADATATAISELCAGQTPPLLEENRIDGAFLLGWAGHLIYLFTHQAVLVPDGIAALGSGCDVSLGAMHVAMKHDTAPDVAVVDAVHLACRFSEGCGVGPGGALVRSL